METADSLSPPASELVEAARRFQSAAAQPGGHLDAPDALVSLQEALQVLSAACYQLAADASPGIAERRRAVVGRRVAADPSGDRRHGNGFPRFQRHDRPGRRVA